MLIYVEKKAKKIYEEIKLGATLPQLGRWTRECGELIPHVIRITDIRWYEKYKETYVITCVMDGKGEKILAYMDEGQLFMLEWL